MAASARKIKTKVTELENARWNWASYWQDLANFCLPSKAWITTSRVSGQKQDFSRIFDSEAIRDLKTMASGFASHLTNPAAKWFNLTIKDKDLAAVKEVKLWLKKAEDEIFSTLNSSNFDPIMQEFYMDAGCFGTGTIFMEEDFKTRIRFTSIPIEQVFILEDARGRVSEVYRKFTYTAQQAFGRWGANAGKLVNDKMASNKFNEKVTFIHAVAPREKFDPTKIDKLNMPFESVWMELTQEHIIEESGFRRFPYLVGRFNKLTGEAWGFSPAMDVLADVKMLNAEKKTLIRAAMKIVDPASLLSSKAFILPFNMNPAATNYANVQNVNDIYKAIETRGNIPIGFEMIRDVKLDIQKGFFVPLFQAFQDITKQMTVPEVMRRISENAVLLGPVVGRFQQEILEPAIENAFSILFTNEIIPPPPRILQEAGLEIDIVYVSMLAIAQRQSEIVTIENFMVDVSNVASILPEVLDKIDGDKMIDVIAEIRRVNPEIVKDNVTVAKIRELRAAAQQQQAGMENIAQMAGVGKDATQAVKNLKE